MSIYASVTGMITKHGRMPVLDSRRERIGWTRTLVRVSVETGDVHWGPLSGEEPVVMPESIERRLDPPEPTPASTPDPNKDFGLFLHLVCDKGMNLSEAAVRAGYAPSTRTTLIQRALKEGLIRKIGRGKYEREREAESA